MQFIRGLGLDSVLEEVKRMRHEPSHPAVVVAPDGRNLSTTLACGLYTGRFPASAADPHGSTAAEKSQAASNPENASVPDPPRAADPTPPSDISTQPEAQYLRSVARIGVQVAEAREYAHQQGILHRDIKPSNLLLDAQGQVWVADFGLAKAQDSDELTRTGDIVGTLRYMAPERFNGWSDPRSDVYALGATLYELLTLRPAFEESDRVKLIQRVVHEAPQPPRHLDRRIPRDLETIVLKALAKEPIARYATAEQMAGDLRRFVAGQPILARRSRRVERLWRWSKRNPVVAGMTAAMVLLLLAVALGGTLSAFRFRAMAGTLESNLYFSDIALAHRECQAENPGRAEKRLDNCPTHLRGWEWYYLRRQSHTALLTIPAHDDHAMNVAYSPDGKSLATSGEDGTVRVFDSVTGRRKLQLPGHSPNICWRVTYSPDGTMLASGGRDKTVRIWEAATGRLIHTLVDYPDTVYGVDFSPDGSLLASSCVGAVQIWDTSTWQRIRTLSGGWSVKFSPDGQFLGSCGRGP
jgi:hypothetical protein